MQKKKAISYVRFSSKRQKGGSSVDRQEAMIADWLTTHPDYDLSTLRYKDLGKSGFKGEHIEAGGGFGDLLTAVEQGRIKAGDVVLVEAIDRAGRLPPMKMLKLIISPILEAGVSIVTLDDNTEYTEASLEGPQIFLLVAKIQAAHGYSKTLSSRVEASYDKRRADAKDGKQIKRWTPVWLTTEGQVIQRIAIHIKEAFELYVSGMGKVSIAVRMRETGEPELAKASGPGVEGWLRNKTVIGYWNDIPNAYDAIIEPSLFYKAQIHAESVKTKRPVKTATHFLVGLVRCGSCGKNYIVQNKNGVPHSMRCRTRQNLKDCDNSHIVPKPVLDTIYRYTSVKATDEAIAQQQMGVNQKEIATQEGKLLELSRQFQNLVQMIKVAGDDPELMEAYKQAKAEREAAESALVILRSTADTPAANAFVKHWQDKGKVSDLQRDDPQLLAAMLRTVDYSITVGADKQITSSHSDVVYRYLGVDRQTDKYKLMSGNKLILVPKKDYPECEPDQPDEPAESVWTEEDYADLQRQYE
jgi:DNA invertase Pin-like site-specific DNA recombinase